MFSNRTRWSLQPNALAAALQGREKPYIDLTVSNPTIAGLALPTPWLARLNDSANTAYDPQPLGSLDARRALSAYLAHPPEQLCLTASTSEAYGFLFKLLCDPGDAVLVPSPSYPLFDFLAGLEAVELHRYPLRYDGEWHIDFGALDAALEAAPRAKAIVTLHPNNPTGNYLRRAELDQLAARCAARGLALISDEVFFEHRIDLATPAVPRFARADTSLSSRGAQRRGTSDAQSVAQLAFAPRAATQRTCLAFSLGGLSKLAALPQLKLGWIAANGPPALLAEALARLEIIADSYLSVSAPVQTALPAILASANGAVATIGARLRENLKALDTALKLAPAVSRLRVEGGWTAVLRLPATRSSEAWALQLLEAADVLVQPGYFYGLGDDAGETGPDAYVVLSLLCATAPFSTGVAGALGAVAAAG